MDGQLTNWSLCELQFLKITFTAIISLPNTNSKTFWVNISTSCPVVVVVVVVDLYSASRSASNVLIVLLCRKKDEFSELIWSYWYTEHGPEVSLRVPFHCTHDGESPIKNVLWRCRGTIDWRWLADVRRWRLETSDVSRAVNDLDRRVSLWTDWQWISLSLFVNHPMNYPPIIIQACYAITFKSTQTGQQDHTTKQRQHGTSLGSPKAILLVSDVYFIFILVSV